MDALASASLASTIIIFVAFGALVSTNAVKIMRHRETELLQGSIRIHETRILHEMGRECEEILRNAPEPPKSVLGAFKTFRDCEREWFALMETLKIDPPHGFLSYLKHFLKLTLLDVDRLLAFSLYKESIMLLRDLCAAYVLP